MNGLDCNAWRRPLRHRLFWWFYEADIGLWVALVITVALALIVLTGCSQRRMTPEEMAAAISKCHQHGLLANARYGGQGWTVSEIVCVPKQEAN